MEETSITQDGKFFDWPAVDNRHIWGMTKPVPNPNPTSPDLVAQRIKTIRAAFDLRKSDLADVIPLDRSSLTKIENGSKPLKAEWCYRIWELYGVPMEYTYRGSHENIPEKLRIAIKQNLTPLD